MSSKDPLRKYKGVCTMAVLTWDNKYSVKVKEMDEQHIKLIGMINNLHDMMKTGKSKEFVAPLLKDMLAYGKEHLSKEEAYMKKYNYPGYDKQREQHVEFVNKIVDLQDKYEKGNLLLSMEILKFLNTWFVNHICNMDAQYATFFNEKGLY